MKLGSLVYGMSLPLVCKSGEGSVEEVGRFGIVISSYACYLSALVNIYI